MVAISFEYHGSMSANAGRFVDVIEPCLEFILFPMIVVCGIQRQMLETDEHYNETTSQYVITDHGSQSVLCRRPFRSAMENRRERNSNCGFRDLFSEITMCFEERRRVRRWCFIQAQLMISDRVVLYHGELLHEWRVDDRLREKWWFRRVGPSTRTDLQGTQSRSNFATWFGAQYKTCYDNQDKGQDIVRQLHVGARKLAPLAKLSLPWLGVATCRCWLVSAIKCQASCRNDQRRHMGGWRESSESCIRVKD